MGIILDGVIYENITPDGHQYDIGVLGESYRSAAATLRRQSADAFDVVYGIDLECTNDEVEALKLSLAKQVALEYTDQRGVFYTPTAGSSTDFIKYNTGVFFEALKVRSINGTGHGTSGQYKCALQLRLISKELP